MSTYFCIKDSLDNKYIKIYIICNDTQFDKNNFVKNSMYTYKEEETWQVVTCVQETVTLVHNSVQ